MTRADKYQELTEDLKKAGWLSQPNVQTASGLLMALPLHPAGKQALDNKLWCMENLVTDKTSPGGDPILLFLKNQAGEVQLLLRPRYQHAVGDLVYRAGSTTPIGSVVEVLLPRASAPGSSIADKNVLFNDFVGTLVQLNNKMVEPQNATKTGVVLGERISSIKVGQSANLISRNYAKIPVQLSAEGMIINARENGQHFWFSGLLAFEQTTGVPLPTSEGACLLVNDKDEPIAISLAGNERTCFAFPLKALFAKSQLSLLN